MEHKDAGNIPLRDGASQEMNRAWLLERKRQYIRDYMRRWRSRPDRQQLEHANRRRSYKQRKLQSASKTLHISAKSISGTPCGICRKRPSITTIVRLRAEEKVHIAIWKCEFPIAGSAERCRMAS
jgi:hypothetical protein